MIAEWTGIQGYVMATITGTSGNDKIWGTQRDDLIQGPDGNDYLNGGAGSDWTITGPSVHGGVE